MANGNSIRERITPEERANIDTLFPTPATLIASASSAEVTNG